MNSLESCFQVLRIPGNQNFPGLRPFALALLVSCALRSNIPVKIPYFSKTNYHIYAVNATHNGKLIDGLQINHVFFSLVDHNG